MRLENSILAPGRLPQICRQADVLPMFPVNVVGQPIRVLPTLVATQNSYAFWYLLSGPGPGLVWDSAHQQLEPLTIEERERALGYSAGCTVAPGVTL